MTASTAGNASFTAAFAVDQAPEEGFHFEITARDGKTEIRFTHVGLDPEYESFDVRSNAWGFYLYTSLRALIRTGHAVPNARAGVCGAGSGGSLAA